MTYRPVYIDDLRPTFTRQDDAWGAPRASAAAQINSVGQVLRGKIQWMGFDADGLLMIATCDRVERLDPDSLEVLDRWELRGVGQLLCMTRGILVLQHIAGGSRVLLGTFGGETAQVAHSEKRMGGLALSGDEQTLVLPTDSGVRVLNINGDEVARYEAPSSNFKGPKNQSQAQVHITEDGRLITRWEGRDRSVMWRDGELLKRDVHYSDGAGKKWVEVEPVEFQSPVFLDAERLVSDGNAYSIETLEIQEVKLKGKFFAVGGGRIALADGYGGYQLIDPQTLEAGEEVFGHPRHYGSQSSNPVRCAVSATHVASLAPTYGTLRVYGAQGVAVRDQHHESLEELTVSRDGARLTVQGSYRGSGLFIDRVAGVEAEVVSHPGMEGLSISDDGRDVIFASGSNHKPRVVHVASLEGGDPEPVHKSMSFSRGTLPFGGRMYAHAAYNLNDNGWVGIFEIGKKRALCKVKDYPRRIAVSADGSTLGVVGRAREGGGALYDLTHKGSKLRDLVGARGLALGSSRDVVAYTTLRPLTVHIERDGQTYSSEVPEDPHYGQAALAWSEDDSALFLMKGHTLFVYASDDGELLAQHPLPCAAESMVARGGTLFILGEDGAIRLYGVPGEATQTPVNAPTLVEIEAEEVTLLPTSQPWDIGAQVALDLGSRTLTVGVRGGEFALFDDSGEPVKSLRKRKTDDPERFEAAKATWLAKRAELSPRRALERALRTGRSALGRELAQYQALVGTLWESRDGQLRFIYQAEGPRDLEGAPVLLEPSARYRLLHPARLDADELARLQSQTSAWQLDVPVHRPTRPQAKEVTPVNTDWAKTSNQIVQRVLESRGFMRHEDSGHADYAITLLAPELNAVAVVSLDTEHGISTLSFHPWDGTPDGGEAMPLEDVDAQLYSAAFAAVVDAYPHDA